MDYDEVLIYLHELERMGLIQKHYDPVSKDFLWELTPQGREAKRELDNDMET
ncbi:MAG: hypothetical protein ACE5G7_01570 [Candidatus Hydrothermarchaeaceae archaeon]